MWNYLCVQGGDVELCVCVYKVLRGDVRLVSVELFVCVQGAMW